MSVSIVAPDRYIGPIMELVVGRRGEYVKTEYLEHAGAPSPSPPSADIPLPEGEGQLSSPLPRTGEGSGVRAGDLRVLLEYRVPLSEMLVDFYDQLKSRTQGYASMDYSFSHYSPEPLVKVEILVNSIPVDALSVLVHADGAQRQGRAIVEKLRSLIPRQLFEVPIQAAIGGRIVARESVKALRKNVLAKCYGGDVTRKRKLLEKQKAGKKRMKRVGNVEIPQEAFMSLLRIGK
jgi:GTP-binding protein LepA